ncbi:F-box/LRR-repeat protein 20-like [Ptychodera flava]|uniref:F-box/LRR-repeat protein 20-like n=1 Tax=Ptychodera flava TaxID=63121 RepID=UPI00396A7746
MCNCVNITANSQAALYRLSELKSLTVSENLDRIAEDDSDEGKIALSNLEEFVLQKSASFYLSDDWMMVLCERLSKLRKLACSGFTVLDDECIVRFAVSCPNLSTVILNITMIGDKTLTALGRNCRLLEHLNVSCCHNVTDVGLCNIAMNCQKLRHLDISGSQPDEDEHQTSSHIQGNATDVAVQHFAMHCPQLTYLNVSSCPGITDLGLVAVAEHCPQLQHLEMTNCIAITDNTLCSVAKHCRHFCHLQASECVQLTSKGVNSLVRMCPSLQIVQLETCHHIAQLNFDPRFHESELVISGRHHTHNDEIETSSSKGMISYCNELAEQDDSDCISVERTETKMSTSPALSNAITDKALKHLNLSCCSKIANGDLKQIASHCPYLQFISLYGCHRITDKGMEILVKRCQYLEYLNIECLRTYRSKLTDLTLVDIADHCRNLQYLNIRGGLQFSKEHIRSVVNACCKLRELRCTMEVKGDVYQYMFLPREPYKAELEGQLTWSQKFHPRYGNPVKQCHLNFKFRPITASGR